MMGAEVNSVLSLQRFPDKREWIQREHSSHKGLKILEKFLMKQR